MTGVIQRIGICLFLSAAYLPGKGAFAATNFVWKGGSNAAPYTSWAAAANDIQSAVNAAAADNTVLVANDTYVLTNGISITKGITVKSQGGASNTLVDGNYPVISTRCFYLQHADAVLDGFTITGGHPIGAWGTAEGGGVSCRDGLVRNCVIISNWATRAGGVVLSGDGVLTNCDVMYNNSGDSGGVVLYGGYAVDSRIVSNKATESLGVGGVMAAGGSVTNCDIIGNNGKYYGGLWFQAGTIKDCLIMYNEGYYGGVYGQSPGGLLTGCTIISNNAYYGGGAYLDTGGTLEDCQILYNVARKDGGGVQIKTVGVLTNCTISGNSVTDNGGGYGGGIYITGAGGKAYNCRVTGNTADYGGGVYFDGYGLLRNGQVTGNMASDAGGVYCRQGGRLENCTIVDNHAQGTYAGAGGLYAYNGGPVSNCIIYYNTSSGYFGEEGNHAIYVTSGSASNAYYTCTTPLVNNEGNTDQLPAFAGWTGGNFTLTEGSPCVDTGSNQAWMAGAVDLNGGPRIFGGRVDMGAYEYRPQIHDLGLEKSVDNETPKQADIITYTLVVTNAGTVEATEVEVSDLLPAGVTYHGNDAPGTYNWVSGVWAIGSLAAEATATLHIEATVDVGSGGASIANVATVSLAGTDVDLSNNTGTASITVQDPGVFRFGAGGYTAREPGGRMRITVVRGRGSNGVAGVEFATSNLTARVEDFDYVSTNGTLVFADGQVEGMFFVEVLDDDILEGHESLHLCLMNPGNDAELGQPVKVALGIRDDEIENITGSWSFGGVPSPGGGEGFTLAEQPAGWTVVMNESPSAGWRFDDPGSRGNLTGGDGEFAIADSAFFGAVAMDSELRSPPLNLTNMLTVVLAFKTDFRQAGPEMADVDVSVSGVAGPWSNVWRKTGVAYRGPATEAVDLSGLARGASNVVFRFRYHGATNAWWWQIDDVELRGEVDDDGDGMPDWWETNNLLDIDAPLGFDTDEDGISDRLEFEADTDPNNSNEYLVIESVLVSGETALRFTSSPWVRYGVDRMPDLRMAGPWSNWVDGVQGIGGPQVIEIPEAVQGEFYRLYGSRP